MTFLFEPPQTLDLPLTTGRDIYFDLIYKPLVVDVDGVPILSPGGERQYAVTNYPTGATVTLEIDTEPQTIVNATVTDHHATINVNYTVSDLIAARTPWRVKFVNGTVDDVLVQGRTRRVDG